MASPHVILRLTIAAVFAAAPSLARAAEPSLEQRVRELEAKGREAGLAGRFDEAAAALREAFEIIPHSATACNLGRVEHMRGRFRDAAELLTLCIESPAPVRTPQEKKRLLSFVSLLAEARARVVTLLLKVNEPGASVLLDGQVAASPPLPRVLFAEPGSHQVTATLDGFAPASTEIKGEAGDSLDINLTLHPAAPKPKPMPPVSDAVASAPPLPLLPTKAASSPRLPPPPEPSTRKTIGAILGVSGGASAVIGAISLGFAASAREGMLRESALFQETRGFCKPEGCGAPEATDAYVTATAVGVTGLVLGGALGVVGGLVGLWPQPAAPQTARALSTVAVW